MQHLDENNMDDLFSEAAEGYPLRVNSSNWERLSAKWEQQSATVAKERNRGLKRYFLPMLLLAFLTGIFLFLFFYGNIKKDTTIIAGKYTRQSERSTTAMNIRKRVFQQTDHKGGNENADRQKSKSPMTNTSGEIMMTKQTLKKQYCLNEHFSSRISNINEGKTKATDDEDMLTTGRAALLQSHKIIPLADVMGGRNLQKIKGPEIDLNPKIAATGKNNPFMIKQRISRAGFYIGAEFGPEVNQVKGQGFNGVTGHLGIVAGYEINGRISLETGLVYSGKKYFSSGQYFNTEKIMSNMPAGMELMTLNSKLALLEIPLKAKLDLAGNERSHVFASIGLTSCVLLNEQNDYNMMVNGVPEKMTGEYHTMSDYFAAFFYIGGGFERQLPNRAVLRLEPYLQIPLKGVGQGSMTVLGAGIHFTATLPLKK